MLIVSEKPNPNAKQGTASGLALLRDSALNRGTGYSTLLQNPFQVGLRQRGLAGKPRPRDVPTDVRAQMFDPHY